jgi:DNA transposition AAA+ family ATPase
MSDLEAILPGGEDRVLIAACVLPNDGPLNDEQRRVGLDNFKRYVEAHQIALSDVSRQVVKPSIGIIRELLAGTFRSDPDDAIRRLNAWVEQDARRRQATIGEPFIETRVALDLLTVARLCLENQSMALACGPSGIGKTFCAKAIAEKYVGSVYLRIIRGYQTAHGLCSAIAGAVGVRTAWGMRQGQYQNQLERVIGTLRDSGRLFLIDEAHQLADAALELLRDIHDETGCPMLLLATKDLQDRIARNADPDHGQVYSRFDIMVHLAEGRDVFSGGRPLYTLDDIRKLYNEPPIRLAKDAEKYLQDVANALGEGSLRRCKVLLRNAARIARRRQGVADGEPVTVTAADLEWVEKNLRRESSEQHRITERQRRSLAASG